MRLVAAACSALVLPRSSPERSSEKEGGCEGKSRQIAWYLVIAIRLFAEHPKEA